MLLRASASVVLWPLVSYGVHSSSCITMSELSVVWICMLTSGDMKSLSPLTGRGKGHALFGDLAHGAQAPDLETARVGEDGLVPLLKAVQAAKALHHIEARAHPQVEGVAQDDLRAHVV